MNGLITKGIGGFYYVKTIQGLYECKPRGIFRKDGIIPLPGDEVCISVLDENTKTGNIDKINARCSELVRPAVANVDQVAIVVSIKAPAPDYILLDKLLISACKKNIDVVICINKIDLDLEGEAKKLESIYSKSGYKTLMLSSKENTGLDGLEDILKGKITVLAGQSGVGKSTLLNSIMKAYIMETGNVSTKIDRGKHTTRHAELLELRTGGYIIDTPGFSSFQISDVSCGDLDKYYPEFRQLIGQCRFNGCSHICEPDCSIKSAVENNELPKERYDRYVYLYEILKNKKKGMS